MSPLGSYLRSIVCHQRDARITIPTQTEREREKQPSLRTSHIYGVSVGCCYWVISYQLFSSRIYTLVIATWFFLAGFSLSFCLFGFSSRPFENRRLQNVFRPHVEKPRTARVRRSAAPRAEGRPPLGVNALFSPCHLP